MCYQPGLSTETTANHILIRSVLFGFLGLRIEERFWLGRHISSFCAMHLNFIATPPWKSLVSDALTCATFGKR